MKKLFGTDGMRGEAGVFPLDEKTIKTVGESLAIQFTEKLGRTPRFIIGRDTRESGDWIAEAFCRGAASKNAVCESAEVITTPGVAFLTKHFDFDAGIVISASHNPFHDNGIKIFSPTGKKLDEATERAIEQYIFEKKEENNDQIENSLNAEKSEQYQKAYLDYLKGEFKDLRLDNLKMVIDCANGAASNLAPQLFKGFGANVVCIYDQPDGKNINHDCGSLHLEKLQAKVIEEKADFGVAFDGDADRSLFVDEKGNLVDGDATLWMMAQHLQDHGKLNNDSVVATVMSNIGLEIALKSKNIELLRTAVGDKYVLEELINTNSSVGGEQSGHIIFPHKSLVGDGMMTTLYLLETLVEKSKTLSEMTEGFSRYPQILVNVKVSKKLPFEEVAEIKEASQKIEEELKGNGRLLLRYSGTENLARVMIEGKNQQEIEMQAHSLADVIRNVLG
ncbi:MAG: phosphoglucosamine mutase [Pyrinomonadaceae bacterium]|nr:phosphoglucosamine mutase [Pyrinomonadaceae bacterium]